MAAGLDALGHVADALAVFGAGGADLRAEAAGEGVAGRAAGHEVGGESADLGAVGHEREVCGLGVFSADFEAVLEDHLLAHLVAVGADLDALAEIVVLAGGRVFRRHVFGFFLGCGARRGRYRGAVFL